MLVFAASEVEEKSLAAGINPGLAGLLGGMTGGVAQAYATMGAYFSVSVFLRMRFLLCLLVWRRLTDY